MDDKKHRPRRRDRSRGRGRSNKPPDRGLKPRRNADGRERDGNVAPKDADLRLGRCSICAGPAPDKANLCRHCASMLKPRPPADTSEPEEGEECQGS